MPIYDFKTHRRHPNSRAFEATPVVIVEGILVLVDPRLRELLDASGRDPATFEIAVSGAVAEPADLDRWAVSRLQATVEEVTSKMDDFDCTAAGRAIAAYVEELSNWYVRLSRRRF